MKHRLLLFFVIVIAAISLTAVTPALLIVKANEFNDDAAVTTSAENTASYEWLSGILPVQRDTSASELMSNNADTYQQTNTSITDFITQETGAGDISSNFTMTASVTVVDDSGNTGGGTGGGGGSSGGGGGSTGDKRFTTISSSSDVLGVLWEEVTALSVDIYLELIIPKDTTVLNANEFPPNAITVMTLNDEFIPPEGFFAPGLVYDLSPEGITLDPFAFLVLIYDDDAIIPGLDEENLCIHTYNPDTESWEALECEVDTETNRITAKITHFSKYTLLAPARPAALSVANLSFNTDDVEVGDNVVITAVIRNSGDLAGSDEFTLTVNEEDIQTKHVSLAGGESTTLTFTIRIRETGTYNVSIGQAENTFTIEDPATEPDTEPVHDPAQASFTLSNLSLSSTDVERDVPVTVSATVTNTGEVQGNYTVVLKIDGRTEASQEITLGGGSSKTVSFTVSRSEPGEYIINCNGKVSTFSVSYVIPTITQTEPAEEADDSGTPVSWSLVAILIVCVVLVGLIAYFFATGKRKTTDR